jgi:hypothetical protein
VPAAAQLWTTGRFDGSPRTDDGMAHSGVTERPGSCLLRSPARLRVLVLEPAAVLRNIMGHALSVQGFQVRAIDRL